MDIRSETENDWSAIYDLNVLAFDTKAEADFKEPNMSNVTLIGLGAMGSALAKALVNGGHATTVWNRTQSGIDSAVSIGATGAANIIEAINASDVLLVCLSNYTATRSILDTDEVRRHLADKTLVQMGTGTPSEARENESWMKVLGGDYLDVTIQPYPEGIGAPESRFFISGSESACKLSLPFLQLFAIHPGASVKTWEGCIKLIQDHARFRELNSEIPDFYSDLFNRAIDSGYGEEDVASIVKVLRE